MERLSVSTIDGADPMLIRQLHEAGLTIDDLSEPGRCFFRFDHPEQGLIGFIGWETAAGEPVALLRSLVVLPAVRGRGWGTGLINWAVQRLAETGVREVYLLTSTIQSLAATLGFQAVERAGAPPRIRDSRQFASLCPASATLMHRRLTRPLQPARERDGHQDRGTRDGVGHEARQLFKDGLFCAESVLLALARRQGLAAAPLPAIATGFCSGMSQTAGPCGALTGAVMALGLVFGRHSGTDPAAPTYQAVKTLVQRFSEEFGATGCADLLGCHLGTPEGQKTFTEQKLHRRCLDYTGRAAELAAAIIDQAGATHPVA